MLSSLLETGSVNRIVTTVILGVVLLATVSCRGYESESKIDAQNTPDAAPVKTTSEITDSNRERALRLTELYNSKSCLEFFNAFPNTFEEFNLLYGFDDEKGERPLYSKYEEHVPYFFDCPEVPASERLEKVVQIGINGRWDADASTLVQDATFKLIVENPGQASHILEGLPDSKASSFWNFMFDGPHPADKENLKKVSSLQSVLSKKSKQSKLLEEQYKKLVAGS